jgi:hypothetical protein
MTASPRQTSSLPRATTLASSVSTGRTLKAMSAAVPWKFGWVSNSLNTIDIKHLIIELDPNQFSQGAQQCHEDFHSHFQVDIAVCHHKSYPHFGIEVIVGIINNFVT